ncbi:MAG: hypothetical protein NTU48_01875 [Legionellales bacterium]|nr:hypothetical protein [Legionellales bacterium]
MKWFMVILSLSLKLTACTYPEAQNTKAPQNQMTSLQIYQDHPCDQYTDVSITNGVARCTD